MDMHTASQSSHASASTSTPPSSSSDPVAEYAWLVHSQNTLRDTLPPNVDNKPLARQRRRRTSPEDQAILEAEYNRNPKPDKSTRRAIVARVAGMGEKEVQIWFQNRRQNSRRRAQPLGDMSLDTSFDDSFASAVPEDEEPRLHSTLPTLTGPSDTLAPSNPSQPSALPFARKGEVDQAMEHDTARTDLPTESKSVPLKDASAASRSLKRTSSGVRISLSSDGSAKLSQANESSPSPPRPEKHLSDLLHLTSDDSMLGLSSSQPFACASKPRHAPSGRSRDSRSWEFWCDSESSNELSLKAKQEASGSASDAISLMRSQSSRSALSTLDRSSWLKRSDSMKKTVRQRPSLGRCSTMSDAMRLSKSAKFELFEDCTAMSGPSVKHDRHAKSPSGDSDKENYDPNALAFPSKRRALAHRGGPEKPVLRKSRTAPNQRTLPKPNANSKGRKGYDHEEDEELQRFVGGGSRGRQPAPLSSEDDLNCVQSLLFLSQGHA